MKYLYRVYQLFVAVPLLIVWTIIISLMILVGCAIGNGHFWGYYPGKWWGWAIIRLLLLPVKVEGRSNMEKPGPKKIKASYDQAREVLTDGISLMVFPEGARTFTGHMGRFNRGAFMLADELQLPVVPITINGSFNVMPRMRDWHWVNWHPLSLTIHQPVYPVDKGSANVASTMTDCYSSVMSSLVPEYQGFVENPDQ